jgi:hypothetical protein
VTRAHLLPCPACARHVRVNEPACPFCKEALPAAFRGEARPEAPRVRLARAALFALGTGTAALACGSSTALGGSPFDEANDGSTQAGDGASDAMSDGVDAMNYGPLYGGFPIREDAGAHDAGLHDAGLDAGQLEPSYGAPPTPRDAGDDAAIKDAEPDHMQFYTLYGAPAL